MIGEAVEVADDALAKQVGDMKITEQGDGAKTEKRMGKDSPRKSRPYEERLKEWEEKQKDKKVVERGCKGTVKWYSVSGRYGFISRNIEGMDDIFVHQSAITKSTAEKFWLRSLSDDQAVEFDIMQGDKGLEAGNVTGPGGEPVKSSPYRRFYFNRGQRNAGRRRDRETPKKEGEEAEGKEEDGEEKPHRRRRHVKPRHRKNNKPNGENKPDGEKEDDEEKPRRTPRNRRPKSESKPEVVEDAKKGEKAAAADAKE